MRLITKYKIGFWQVFNNDSIDLYNTVNETIYIKYTNKLDVVKNPSLGINSYVITFQGHVSCQMFITPACQ